MKKTILTITTIVFTLFIYAQQNEDLAQTPPMGWNSWNTFATEINEQLIKEIADKMVESGLRDAGYVYLNLDDGWMAMERDENGKLYADPVKFPSGMKALGDYIHSKGLKYGIYNCAGATTCAGYPGSRGHEYTDAETYAEWGVDYLKYDWCNTENLNAKGAYQTMHDALLSTKRPIVFSICEWGTNQPWKWGEEMGNLWRVSGDIANCWDCENGHGSWSSLGIWKIINLRKDIRKYAGPGHWNDLDMMEVGNDLTDQENRSHFAMWSILASPLIMGNDIREMSPETHKLLINKEIIAVNQDPLGLQGYRFLNFDGIEVWVKPLSNEEWAVAFVNMNNEPYKLDFNWNIHEIEDALNQQYAHMKTTTYRVKDLISHKELNNTSSSLKKTIEKHDVVLVRLFK